MLTRDIIIWDVDGVLADIRHREHWVSDKQNKDWDSFFAPEQMMRDLPIRPNIVLLNTVQSVCDTVLLTARPDRTRAVTLTWCDRHNVRYSRLITRPDGDVDFQGAAQWKAAEVEKLVTGRHNILGFYDDRTKNVDAVAALGVPAFQLVMAGRDRDYPGNH